MNEFTWIKPNDDKKLKYTHDNPGAFMYAILIGDVGFVKECIRKGTNLEVTGEWNTFHFTRYSIMLDAIEKENIINVSYIKTKMKQLLDFYQVPTE